MQIVVDIIAFDIACKNHRIEYQIRNDFKKLLKEGKHRKHQKNLNQRKKRILVTYDNKNNSPS